ncbi:MAG: hypothetical protein ABEJ44_08005 [Halanaeroarchaeum sp.]
MLAWYAILTRLSDWTTRFPRLPDSAIETTALPRHVDATILGVSVGYGLTIR